MTKLRVLLTQTHNPWFNLATEDWIFREMDPTVQTLFLWRNSETVVIGRNQNPWSECNLARMEKDGVILARRTTGGGAVFHDLQNTNFTFLSPREGYDRSANLSIVLNALKPFGIEGRASGRNDLVVMGDEGPRKFSGSAFRETRDRAFHHGTLLLNTDLSRLGDYLTPHPKKLESKGKASVRGRVMNLAEIAPDLTHENLVPAIVESFFEWHGGRCEVEVLDPDHLEGQKTLKDQFEKYGSWEWRFGHAPQFKHQMVEYLSWGFIEVHLDSEQGRISRVQVFSDSLFPFLIEGLQTALCDKPYSRAGMAGAIAEIRHHHPGFDAELSELEFWLKTQVEV